MKLDFIQRRKEKNLEESKITNSRKRAIYITN